MSRQGFGGDKWFWGIREKSLGTNTRFESQRWEEEDGARVWQARDRYGGQREKLGQRQGCCRADRAWGAEIVGVGE